MPPEVLQRLVDHLRAVLPDLWAVYLFGSEVQGHTRADSDVDIAILAERPLNADQRWNLAARLGEIARKDVDLIDLRAAGLPLGAQVLEFGRVIFTRDPAQLALFENLLMSQWCDFNQERRPLVADILHRGSVYGR